MSSNEHDPCPSCYDPGCARDGTCPGHPERREDKRSAFDEMADELFRARLKLVEIASVIHGNGPVFQVNQLAEIKAILDER